MTIIKNRLKRPIHDIQTFITSWPRVQENSERLRAQLSPYGICHYLNNPNWYFSEQWNQMKNLFSGEVLLWVMGDVVLPDNYPDLYQAMLRAMQRPEVGVWGPNIDFTFHKWDTSGFPRLFDDEVYVVPCGEPNFWAVKRSIIDNVPHIDLLVNYIGWGIDFQVSSVAETLGMATVRDYRYTVKHPTGTNYDSDKAEYEMNTWIETLEPRVRDIVIRRWEQGMDHNLIAREKKTQENSDEVHSSDHNGIRAEVS